MSKLRLAIAIPAYGGQISAHHARQWMEFGNTLGGSAERFELVAFDFYDVNGIDQARNLMLARAAQVQADWLLMIDADTWVEPSALDRQAQTDAGFLLLRMISDADRRAAAAVAAPVVRRQVVVRERAELARAVNEQLALVGMAAWMEPPPAGVIDAGVMLYRATVVTSLEDRAEDVPPAIMETSYRNLELAGLKGQVEVDAAATAVFAVNVPRALGCKAVFAFVGGRGEDIEFCRQLRAAGLTILADLRVRTGHMSRSAPLFSTVDA